MIDTADKKRPWTPRRVFRWVGAAAIGIALLMALFGAYGLGSKVSIRVFYIYWSVFFFFLMCAIALATLDALATVVWFSKEHMELHETAGRAPAADRGDVSPN